VLFHFFVVTKSRHDRLARLWHTIDEAPQPALSGAAPRNNNDSDADVPSEEIAEGGTDGTGNAPIEEGGSWRS